jgi:putative ABC transport system substrate-binding protein
MTHATISGTRAMARRAFLSVVTGGALAPLFAPRLARAQQGAMPAIGFLDPRTIETLGDRLRGLRQGLKETGHLEGENVSIVYHFADNNVDRLPELAADLVRRNVALIVSSGPQATAAARAASKTIPVLFLVSDDPVRLGLVASLSRPGGTLTGINIFNTEVTAKRLELLRELLPRATRIAALLNPSDVKLTETHLKEIAAAARTIGLKVDVLNADTNAEIDAAFETMGRDRPDAVFVGSTPFFNGRRVELAQLAAFHRLPATYALRECAEVGGLMSYGTNIVDAYRQAGIYAGRILKGAKVAELPVVQANKFELVINAHTARMLGLVVPPSLLALADEVIE